MDTVTLDNMITVFANPVADFDPTPAPATIIDPTITLNNLSSSDVIYWYWNFGDGDSLMPDVSSPVHKYPDESPGTYTTTLIVTNSNNCSDTTDHEIIIGPDFTFYLPNAFTPNDDGKNDTFFGQGIGIVLYDLWIFDRWGNMIFHTDQLNGAWDGKANGGSKTAQTDVYIWKVVIKDILRKKHELAGTVTIVK